MTSVIGQGIKKQTIIKKQTALGSIASGSGGQVLRRRTSVFELTKSSYQSDEIVSHQQSTGARYGMGQTKGKLNGLLSPGTYKLLLASALRCDFVAGANSGAITDVTAQVAAPQFVSAGTSFLTQGFKQFDVIRWTGWAVATANNSRNFWITSISANGKELSGVFLDGTAAVVRAPGDTVTATVAGKKSVAPLTGHTDDLFTVEEWQPDLASPVSAVYGDTKLNQVAIALPASGNATADFDFIGLSESITGAQVLTTPTAETTTEILQAVHGLVQINGTTQTIATGLSFTIAENATLDGPVIGSNAAPDISHGRIMVTGQFTALFKDSVLPLVFANETNIAIAAVMTSDTTAASDFMGFSMTRVKLGSDTPDDGEKGIVRTYSFTAELDSAGGSALANSQTIMSIQDSAA